MSCLYGSKDDIEVTVEELRGDRRTRTEGLPRVQHSAVGSGHQQAVGDR